MDLMEIMELAWEQAIAYWRSAKEDGDEFERMAGERNKYTDKRIEKWEKKATAIAMEIQKLKEIRELEEQ